MGLCLGVLVAAATAGAFELLRDDPVEGVAATYRLSEDDALGPGPVSLISVRDMRQPTSIPGLAAPTGERYVSVVLALERRDASAQEWFTLEDFSVSLYAVDGSGERDELLPTASSRRLLEGVGGRLRGIDPYWIQLDYEPPSGAVDEFEVGVRVDGRDLTSAVRAEAPE